jgi:hypothetical protein
VIIDLTKDRAAIGSLEATEAGISEKLVDLLARAVLDALLALEGTPDALASAAGRGAATPAVTGAPDLGGGQEIPNLPGRGFGGESAGFGGLAKLDAISAIRLLRGRVELKIRSPEVMTAGSVIMDGT